MLSDSIITTQELDGFLISATSEVLEKMFFTGIESSGDSGEIETNSPIYVELNFSGPMTGALRLRMDEEAARCLGSTLTCMEADEFPRERCVQTAGELANMICGCLLSHLEPDANLELSPPSEVPEKSVLLGCLRRWFCLPEGALAVEFALDQQPAGTG